MAFLRKAKEFLLAIAFFAICFIPVIFVAALVCFFRCLRSILGIYLSLTHGKQIKFIDGLDAIHLRRFDESQITTGVPLYVNGVCDVQSIQQRFAKLLTEVNENKQLVAERFTVGIRKCLGFCYWLPMDEMRIEDHVTPWQGDKPATDDELHGIYAQLYTQGTKYTEKPPWKVHIIQLADNYSGLEGHNYVLFFCFHHALTDGISLTRMIVKHLSVETINYEQRLGGGKGWSNMLYLAATILYIPLSLMKYFKGLKDSNCLTGPQLNGTKLIAFSQQINLDRVKRIKNLTGTTVNDVLMSCVAAALRNYCLARKDDMSKAVLHCAMPIAFHDMSQPIYLHNNCSFVSYEFPLKESSAMDRLLATKRRTNELKSDVSSLGLYYFAKYCYNSLPVFLYYLVAWRCHVSAVVSNNPGSQKMLKIFSDHVMFRTTAIISNSAPKTGVSLALVTCNNMLQFGINVDAAIISDREVAQRLVDDCVSEVENLESALQTTK